MTRPRVVRDRGEPEDGSVGATFPVVPLWSAEPEPPVAGTLSRYSLLLPGRRPLPGWRSLSDRVPVR